MGEVGRFPEWVEAIVFDLDGTLVETELLKARSYAKVAQELHECAPEDRLRLLQSDSDCQKTIRDVQSEREEILHPIVAPATISEGQKCADRAMKVFLTNLGATSEYIARKLVDELEIEPLLRPAMERFGEEEPWKALYKLRKEMYYDTFATEKNLYESRYPEALKIVEYARQSGIPLAVATSSSTGDAERVLEALRIRSDFKFVVGRDQVSKAKPDPEIYLKAVKLLGASPEKSLAFEDSVTGLTAGLAAHMHVVAIASPFTKDSLQAQALHPQHLVAYDPAAIWKAIHVA